MGFVEILFISVGLAMDAFAVSICKGMCMQRLDRKNALIIALYFGLFQALMPVAGYFLGSTFQGVLTQLDHWIALILLALIGINMIREAIYGEDESESDSCVLVNFRTMVVLAIATSIDALAVGITFAFLRVDLLLSVSLIGLVTFGLCLVGVVIGNKFGGRLGKSAQIFGGIVLILIGIKIVLDHLNILHL